MSKHIVLGYVTIAGVRTKVVEAELDEDGTYGDFSQSKRVIRIAKDAPDPDGVLRHELVHAWLSYTGLAQILGKNKEEALCISAEAALANVIVTDNILEEDENE